MKTMKSPATVVSSCVAGLSDYIWKGVSTLMHVDHLKSSKAGNSQVHAPYLSKNQERLAFAVAAFASVMPKLSPEE